MAKPTNNRILRNVYGKAVAMAVLIAAAMLILPCCQHKPVMTHSRFVNLPPSGWLRSVPLTFIPEYDATDKTYGISLAFRHDNTYPYRNLSLVVDIIAADSAVSRRAMEIEFADEYGNWKGGGFGALYQDTINIVERIDPDDAHCVVVWQAMEGCDTLRGLVNLGIIVRPL